MREPPEELSDAAVLGAVAAGWGGAERVEHLPLGFGAHHWRASDAHGPTWFATYDRADGDRVDALRAAYRAAVRLARDGLGFVVAPVPTTAGDLTVPVTRGVLSCTPWLEAEALPPDALRDPATAQRDAAILRRLHAAAPPEGLPRWAPVAGGPLLERLRSETAEPWTAGPFGEAARRAIADRLDRIAGWADRHGTLAAAARDRPWVPTHGETQPANQLRTAAGLVLVDWESLRLAPRERDLGALVAAGRADLVDADPAMLELFALDWRLGEVDAYGTWFREPHIGSRDDRIALEGLHEELAADD